MSNNNIKNIGNAASDSIAVATESVALAITLTAGAIKLAGAVIKSTPEVGAAALNLHKATRSGYRQEDLGLTKEVADAEAEEFFDVTIAQVVTKAGRGAGKLTAQLFDSLNDDDNKADTSAEEAHRVA